MSIDPFTYIGGIILFSTLGLIKFRSHEDNWQSAIILTMITNVFFTLAVIFQDIIVLLAFIYLFVIVIVIIIEIVFCIKRKK
jgi:Sec-independent protein secretion pathway component TatC